MESGVCVRSGALVDQLAAVPRLIDTPPKPIRGPLLLSLSLWLFTLLYPTTRQWMSFLSVMLCIDQKGLLEEIKSGTGRYRHITKAIAVAMAAGISVGYGSPKYHENKVTQRRAHLIPV